MKSLTDRADALASVFGPAVDGWARDVLAEPEPEAKIALASAFLVARLRRSVSFRARVQAGAGTDAALVRARVERVKLSAERR